MERGHPLEFSSSIQDAEAFLWKDLEHLFDDQGIDSSRYEEAVNFSDPISKFSSLRGRSLLPDQNHLELVGRW